MEYEILNARGARAFATFTSWLDAIRVIAKLHRLGMVATLRRIAK